MSKLSDSEVVERLARRLGSDAYFTCGDCDPCVGGKPEQCVFRQVVLDITSKDALAPVLAGLSPDEWRRLNRALCHAYAGFVMYGEPVPGDAVRYFLTLDVKFLAHTIAEALGEPERKDVQ